MKNQAKKSNVIFLSDGSGVPKDKVERLENPSKLENKEHLDDIENLSKTALRLKYSHTYSCWKNMKQRKKKGAIIHHKFERFDDFLRYMGPCEIPSYSLDRIDPTNPEYGPGLVRWVDRYVQNSNRGNAIFLTHDDTRRHTIAQWAAITNQKANTLYRRKSNGWTDMEIITGKRASPPTSTSPVDDPFPHAFRASWEDHYIQAVGDGYGGTRLQYLNEESYKLTGLFTDACADLEMQLQHLDDDSQRLRIEKKLREVSGKLQRARQIFLQTSEQIEYEREKHAFLAQFDHNKEVKKKQKDNLQKVLPRPPYSINQPGMD